MKFWKCLLHFLFFLPISILIRIQRLQRRESGTETTERTSVHGAMFELRLRLRIYTDTSLRHII